MVTPLSAEYSRKSGAAVAVPILTAKPAIAKTSPSSAIISPKNIILLPYSIFNSAGELTTAIETMAVIANPAAIHP